MGVVAHALVSRIFLISSWPAMRGIRMSTTTRATGTWESQSRASSPSSASISTRLRALTEALPAAGTSPIEYRLFRRSEDRAANAQFHAARVTQESVGANL